MAGSQKRNFSKTKENWSDDICLDDIIENANLHCKRQRKSSIGKKERLDQLKDLIEALCKLNPNVFKKDKPSLAIVCKLIEDLFHIEELIKNNEEYTNNTDYIIQAQKIGNEFKYNTIINSGGLLENIGETVVEKYLNQPTSYYEENFREIKLLGSGTFGRVYTANQKIVNQVYAIKKIKIKSCEKKQIQHSLNEVRILAKLHHPNVIEYKHAWLEPLKENEFQSSQSSESSQSNGDDSSMNGIKTDMEICTLNSAEEHVSGNESSQDSLDIKTGQMFTLYIQMPLTTMNLRKWIDNRSEPSDELIIRDIAKQVLRGLNYIHQLQIVHHDINPNNILVTVDSFDPNKLKVQIGDFGLARNLLKNNNGAIGGTRPYCAPEQTKKKNKSDSKSDIFSFGIVLFELLYPMQTFNELCRELERLKEGYVPPSILNNYPVWDIVLMKSIDENPQLRASAENLLNILTMVENMTDEKNLRRNTLCCCRKIQNSRCRRF